MAESRIRNTTAPLVVIVAPTASGKTKLAVRLAKQFSGEIICADSRTIYKEMDIGTAKPTSEEQEGVPHWGLDLIEPGVRFTAADFKRFTEVKIDEIRARNHTPFLVGGSGLYIDSVLFNYQFDQNGNVHRRAELEAMSVEELQRYCVENNIKLPENTQNKRYLIRAIEQNGINYRRSSTPISNSIIVGIATDKAVLDERIAHRVEQLFEDGVVKEAINLGKKYGWDNEAFTGNIYRVINSYLKGTITEAEMKKRAIIQDRQLAKKQRTWFNRNPFITWLPLTEAYSYITKQLAK